MAEGGGEREGQKRPVKVAIAARAALRVLPLAVRAAPETAARQFANLTSAIFRSTALARVVARYPTRRNELRAAARDATDEGVATAARAGAGTAAARAAEAAAAEEGAAAADEGAAAVWEEIRSDVAAF